MTKQYKIIYWSILISMLVFAGILEAFPALDGLLISGSMLEFCLQYALILITLVAVYAALKMIKKNPVLRMGLLEAPALANIVCYHLFMNASFGYLAIVCALAFVFVYPAKVDDDANNDENGGQDSSSLNTNL